MSLCGLYFLSLWIYELFDYFYDNNVFGEDACSYDNFLYNCETEWYSYASFITDWKDKTIDHAEDEEIS